MTITDYLDQWEQGVRDAERDICLTREAFNDSASYQAYRDGWYGRVDIGTINEREVT